MRATTRSIRRGLPSCWHFFWRCMRYAARKFYWVEKSWSIPVCSPTWLFRYYGPGTQARDQYTVAWIGLSPHIDVIRITCNVSRSAGRVNGHAFGFLSGAASYTVRTGFPFALPEDFSYNAIAGMYLFGLLSILLWGWYTRQRLLCLLMAIVTMSLIAATTSIKTNLGVLLGASTAAVIYFTTFARIIGRSAIVLVVVTVAIGYAIVSNETLLNGFKRGSTA